MSLSAATSLRYIMNKTTPHDLFVAKRELISQLKKIPKKNKSKFACDLLMLVQFAQKDNYDTYNFFQ